MTITEKRKFRFNAKYAAVLAEFAAVKDVRYYLNGAFITKHPDSGVLLVAADGSTAVIIHDPEGETNGDHIFPLSKAMVSASKKRYGGMQPQAVEVIDEAAYVRLLMVDLSYDPAITQQDIHVEHCPIIDAKYPDLATRVVPSGDPEPSVITMNPNYMARLAKVGKHMGLGRNAISCFTYGETSSMAVRLDGVPEALFIIMPMHKDDNIKHPVEPWLKSYVDQKAKDQEVTK
jgi:hypothetical protein